MSQTKYPEPEDGSAKLNEANAFEPFARDPVIEAYKQHVDRTILRENLKRISTQEMLDEEGDNGVALKSLYDLFQSTRKAISEMEPTPNATGDTVETYALDMLNTDLRPFLSKWHPCLGGFRQRWQGHFSSLAGPQEVPARTARASEDRGNESSGLGPDCRRVKGEPVLQPTNSFIITLTTRMFCAISPQPNVEENLVLMI